jgi:hypothetical protein
MTQELIKMICTHIASKFFESSSFVSCFHFLITVITPASSTVASASSVAYALLYFVFIAALTFSTIMLLVPPGSNLDAYL